MKSRRHQSNTDLFRPIYDRTDGVDGWVSLEVSPLLARNTAATLAAARALHNLAARPNLFIRIPGTSEGLPVIEEAIFRGVPLNVNPLFSGEQYAAAAEAYMRGIERRMPEATLNALAAHWEFGEALPENNDKIFIEFAIAGIDTDAVATQLVEEGIASFAKSWNDQLDCIASKSEALKTAVV
jgi:transaldolase